MLVHQLCLIPSSYQSNLPCELCKICVPRTDRMALHVDSPQPNHSSNRNLQSIMSCAPPLNQQCRFPSDDAHGIAIPRPLDLTNSNIVGNIAAMSVTLWSRDNCVSVKPIMLYLSIFQSQVCTPFSNQQRQLVACVPVLAVHRYSINGQYSIFGPPPQPPMKPGAIHSAAWPKQTRRCAPASLCSSGAAASSEACPSCQSPGCD